MKIEVTQTMTVTMTKIVDIPLEEAALGVESAQDYAYDNGGWTIAKIHASERAEYEIIDE